MGSGKPEEGAFSWRCGTWVLVSELGVIGRQFSHLSLGGHCFPGGCKDLGQHRWARPEELALWLDAKGPPRGEAHLLLWPCRLSLTYEELFGTTVTFR